MARPGGGSLGAVGRPKKDHKGEQPPKRAGGRLKNVSKSLFLLEFGWFVVFLGGRLTLKLQIIIYGPCFSWGSMVLLTQMEGNHMETWHYWFMINCELSDT